MKPTGIAIISLLDIYQKTDKTKATYFLLTYQLHRALTNQYLQLTSQRETLKSNRQPLFLFNAKKKFAASLTAGQVYWIAYTTTGQPTKYLHLQDWRILGDKLTIQRSWNLLIHLTQEPHLLS